MKLNPKKQLKEGKNIFFEGFIIAYTPSHHNQSVKITDN